MDHDKVNQGFKGVGQAAQDATAALREFAQHFRKFKGKGRETTRRRKPHNPLRSNPQWQRRRKKAMAGRKANVKRMLAMKKR